MNKLASEVIREARTMLFERGWCQKKYSDFATGAVCIRYALHLADKRSEDVKDSIGLDVETALAKALGYSVVCVPGLTFNDAPGRTFDDIIDALDRAEKLALIAEEAAA